MNYFWSNFSQKKIPTWRCKLASRGRVSPLEPLPPCPAQSGTGCSPPPPADYHISTWWNTTTGSSGSSCTHLELKGLKIVLRGEQYIFVSVSGSKWSDLGWRRLDHSLCNIVEPRYNEFRYNFEFHLEFSSKLRYNEQNRKSRFLLAQCLLNPIQWNLDTVGAA